ncbi:MAG: hypothetical protein KDB61_08650 [Planctomycetes bacterium]|nr:hypothetical protein [Planctomycetota bacterium]
MNRLILAASLALGSTSCYMTKSGYDFTAAGQNVDSHWTVQSTFPRMGRFFLGYDSQRDGTYKDFAYARKQSVELTLRRHFLNHNPDNPNHAEVASRFEPRPNNSILPNPLRYFHVESVLLGAALTPVTGGVLIPIPLDSLIGTFEVGGVAEFFGMGLDKDEVITASAIPASLEMGDDQVVGTVTQISK